MNAASRWHALRAASVALALQACLLPSFEKVDGGGGGSAGSGGEGGAGAACETVTLEPAPEDPEPGGQISFFAAMRTLDLGEGHLASRPGMDLDGVCTCCTGCNAAASCVAPRESGMRACDERDGQPNQGRDNNAANLILEGISLFGAELRSDAMTNSVTAGAFTILVGIFHYNGLPDDGAVSVALYAATTSDPPLWLGEDTWSLLDSSLAPEFADLEDALVLRDDAYVRDGTLVARFGDTPLSITLPNRLVVTLHDGVVQAKVEQTPELGFRLMDGVLAGTWLTADAFRGIGGMRRAGMAHVCTLTVGYDQYVHTPLCALRDSATPANPDAPCNGVSFGLAFTADPVGLPTIVSAPEETPCGKLGEPAADSCL